MKDEGGLIAEAIGDLHKGETLERALGRIVRRNGGTYEDYVRIMGNVRDLASREDLTPMQAARRLAHL